MHFEEAEEISSSSPPRIDTALAQSTLGEIEQIVCRVSSQSSLDELCTILNAADWVSARAKSIQLIARQIGIAWIERNGEFDIGDLRYKVGYTATTKCTNPKQAGIQLLESLQGDFSGFLDLLVAQPFKPGSAKRVLDVGMYRRLFRVSSTSRLVAGVPERTLIRSRSL